MVSPAENCGDGYGGMWPTLASRWGGQARGQARHAAGSGTLPPPCLMTRVGAMPATATDPEAAATMVPLATLFPTHKSFDGALRLGLSGTSLGGDDWGVDGVAVGDDAEDGGAGRTAGTDHDGEAAGAAGADGDGPEGSDGAGGTDMINCHAALLLGRHWAMQTQQRTREATDMIVTADGHTPLLTDMESLLAAAQVIQRTKPKDLAPKVVVEKSQPDHYYYRGANGSTGVNGGSGDGGEDDGQGGAAQMRGTPNSKDGVGIGAGGGATDGLLMFEKGATMAGHAVGACVAARIIEDIVWPHALQVSGEWTNYHYR